jgi:hypothetical protein
MKLFYSSDENAKFIIAIFMLSKGVSDSAFACLFVFNPICLNPTHARILQNGFLL